MGRADPEKVEHELWRLAQEILRLGLSVVLDFGLWARIERDEMRSAARGLGVGVELHYLDVPTNELWRRIDARNSQPPWDSYPISRADLDGWLRIFHAPDAAELALFDTPPESRLTHRRRDRERAVADATPTTRCPVAVTAIRHHDLRIVSPAGSVRCCGCWRKSTDTSSTTPTADEQRPTFEDAARAGHDQGAPSL